jgi:hypothetical protein
MQPFRFAVTQMLAVWVDSSLGNRYGESLKRPWLTTPKGQRITMLLGTLLSLLALIPLYFTMSSELARTNVSQLQFGEVNFYPLDQAKSVSELAGLEVLGISDVSESLFGTTLKIQVLNHGQLVGKREVWAKVYSPAGHLREGMKIWLDLKPKGPIYLEFFFTGTAQELSESKISLGF